VRRLKRPECVRADGAPIRVRDSVHTGARIELFLPDSSVSSVLPQALPLTILHEDADVLVVDKPAGMLVHPSSGEGVGTLANAVAHHIGEGGRIDTPAPVTRLDRDTSGVVLFAKHPHVHHRLSVAIAQGDVQRSY